MFGDYTELGLIQILAVLHGEVVYSHALESVCKILNSIEVH